MTPPSIPERLARAAAVAAPLRSVVDDVLAHLPPGPPPAPPRRARWVIAAAATAAGLAAIITFVLTLVGPSARLTFAEVRVAFEQQRWVHVRYDAGQNRDVWTNLRTGEWYGVKQGLTCGGEVFYIDMATNVRRFYSKRGGVIDQDAPEVLRPGQRPTPWTPHTAWQEIVGWMEQSAASTQPAGANHTEALPDTLGGRPVVRFDQWGTDALGKPILYTQLWADPATHLPVRIRKRLQLGDREEWHREWATGDYDFPATGPADLAALGVPVGTPTVVHATTAPADVQPVLDAINRCHDDFLKHYRAVVVSAQPGLPWPVDDFHIVWRNDEQVRDNRYMVPFELQSHPRPPLTDASPNGLVAWAAQHEAADMQMIADGREYTWTSAAVRRAARPQVQVSRHFRHSLLSSSAWPEAILWPTVEWAPEFSLLTAVGDAPPGCIGLRWGGQCNQRTDYYVDPARDYVCVKQVSWDKRAGAWRRTRETTLSDLHRVAGRVVAGAKHDHDFADPTRGTDEYEHTVRIDIQTVPSAVYPPGTFDPATLMTGADVVGF